MHRFHQKKISKGFEQKIAENRLQTPFKIQVGSQIARLPGRAIRKPNCLAINFKKALELEVAEGFQRLKKSLLI